jgi:hypothetical protein
MLLSDNIYLGYSKTYRSQIEITKIKFEIIILKQIECEFLINA